MHKDYMNEFATASDRRQEFTKRVDDADVMHMGAGTINVTIKVRWGSNEMIEDILDLIGKFDTYQVQRFSVKETVSTRREWNYDGKV